MRIALPALLLLLACSDPPPADDAGPPDAGSTPRDAGAPDAGPPLLEPGLFDCSATGTPDRVSTRPLHCGLDPTCIERLVSAHRGAGAPSVFAPENTLASIRAAIALGVDMIELDARPSADGTLVLMHDETVDRTTEGTGRVDALTVAELQALSLRADAFDGDFSCESVPTLADAIAVAAGRVTLIVEPKTDRIEVLVQTIRDAGALGAVVLDVSPEDAEVTLSMEPSMPFFVRASAAAEVDPLLTRFAATPPRYVHVGASADPTLITAVETSGQRTFGLAFGADIAADLRGSPRPYVDLWEAGIQMLQCNRPDLAVAALRE